MGDVGNQLLPVLVHLPPLGLALRQLLGKAVQALPDAADLPGTAPAARLHRPVFRLGHHRVVEPPEGAGDGPPELEDEQGGYPQIEGEKEQPDPPGLLIGGLVGCVAQQRHPQHRGHGPAVRGLEGGAEQLVAGEQLELPLGIAASAVAKAAESHL